MDIMKSIVGWFKSLRIFLFGLNEKERVIATDMVSQAARSIGMQMDEDIIERINPKGYIYYVPELNKVEISEIGPDAGLEYLAFFKPELRHGELRSYYQTEYICEL